MSEHRETYNAGAPDELPADLKDPLTRLWRIERSIVVSIKPRDMQRFAPYSIVMP